MTKKTRRILCVLLTLFMLIPMFGTFASLSAAADTPVAYADAHRGDKLLDWNFSKEGWEPSLSTSDEYNDLDVKIQDDGNKVYFMTKNSQTKRGIWGAAFTPEYPLSTGTKYTVYYHLNLAGADTTGCAFLPDGSQGITVFCNGDVQMRQWGTASGTKSNIGSSDVDHDFAVEIDYDEETVELFVKKDGSYQSVLKSDLLLAAWDGATTLHCSFFVGQNTKYNDAYVSDLSVYKGLCCSEPVLHYEDVNDGDLLQNVNFKAVPEDGWEPGLSSNDNYNDLDVTVSDDGKSVTFKALSTNSKRGIWGDAFFPSYPLTSGVKYTFYFQLQMEEGMRVAFYPDGAQGIAIFQKSTYTQYQKWASTSGSDASWANKTDFGKNLKDFAIELDDKTLTLYGKNINGHYSYINQATVESWEDSELCCSFFSGNTTDKTATVSNFSVYKGLVVDDSDAPGTDTYDGADDGDLLQTVNFKATGWEPDFASSSNSGAQVTVSDDGSAVNFKVLTTSSSRAMWGDQLVEPLPLASGVKYTFVFDLTFGNDGVGFGIIPDGNNGLIIAGNGHVYWYNWNTVAVNKADGNSERWNYITDVPSKSKQTFALEMDYSAKTFTLYVQNKNGTFGFVTSKQYSNAWEENDSINCRFHVRKISGTVDDTFTADVSDLKIYKGVSYNDRYVFETMTGASVRLSEPTGLRFSALFGKGLVDGLKAQYGAENVKIGMFITPTDYLTGNSLAFTKAALDACDAIEGAKYAQIEAVTVLESDDGNAYLINCALAPVNEANYDRLFSAIAYIEIIEDGSETYSYSGYNAKDHSRSVGYVAALALEDVNDTQENEYQYAVNGGFSPYTEAEREILSGFAGNNLYTVMQYNVEIYDSSNGWEDGRDPAEAMDTVLSVNPDLVSLNEVDSHWTTYTATLTSNGYSMISPANDTHKPVILYKTAKFDALDSGYAFYKATAAVLSVPNDEEADQTLDKTGSNGRMFTWALLQEKTTGKKVLYISTHLHYGGTGSGHEEDDKLRRYEIKTMLAWIEQNPEELSYDSIIVCGDMNSHYIDGQGKVNMEVFENGGFGLTVEEAPFISDNGGTLDVTGHTTREKYVFDYVMIKGNVNAVYYSVIDNKGENPTYPSDHLPIVAKVFCY